MRVWFVLMDEVFFLPRYLDQTLSQLPAGIEVVGVTPVGQFDSAREAVALLRERMAAFGTWEALLLATLAVALRFAAHVTPGGTLLGRPLTVEAVARKHNVAIEPTTDVNSIEFAQRLREEQVDVVVSSNPVIFERELLEAPTIGCINRHTSYLPNNRGLYPVYWALAKGQEYTGATVHWMNEEIDEGNIIHRSKIPIEPSDTLVSLYVEGYDVSADVTARALRDIKSGEISEIPNQGGSYNSKPDAEAISRFHAQPNRVLSISDIPDLLRW